MARSKKPTTSRFGWDAAIPPYTDQKRQFYEFTTAKRAVRIGGEMKMMSNTELVNLKQLEAALAGNSIAQRDHQRQAEESILAREHSVRTQCEMWTAYKEMVQQAIDRARVRNEPHPHELPHPADVLIDWAEGVTIAGPTDEAGLKRWQGLVHFRDALFVQQIMEDADNRVPMEERLTTGAALVHGMLINRRLPLSLQLSEAELELRLFGLRRLSKREAFVRCREVWKVAGAGRQIPRGRHYGTLEKLIPMIEAEAALCNAVRRETVDAPALEKLIEAFMLAIQDFVASVPKGAPKQTKDVAKEEVHA